VIYFLRREKVTSGVDGFSVVKRKRSFILKNGIHERDFFTMEERGNHHEETVW